MPSFVNLLRPLLCMCLVGIGLLRAATEPVDVFRPTPDGGVNALAVTPDGRLLMGGAFGIMKGDLQTEPFASSKIVMLKMDGSIDMTFRAGVDAPVHSLLVQPDGKFVVGGVFKNVQDGKTFASTAKKSLVRLNADSSIDASFTAGVSDSFATKAYVYTIVRQNDGKLIVGGAFDQAYGTGQTSPTTVGHLVRFNADGTIDTSFSAIFNNQVNGVALQPDGKIIVVGGFTTCKGKGDSTATTRNRIARLNTDGSLDTTFNPNANNLVSAVQILADGRIMVGGSFTSFTSAEGDTIDQSFIARLNTNGTVDEDYAPTVNAAVLSLRLQSNGYLLVGGRFTELKGPSSSNSVVVGYFARLSPEGVPDETFNPFLDQYVTSMVALDDGRVIAGGWFRNARRAVGQYYITSPYVARFTPDGSYDTYFRVGGSSAYSMLALQSDGKILVGGSFTNIAGLGTKNLVRLDSTGALDTTFSTAIEGTVLLAKVLKNGKIAIGGTFTKVNDVSKTYFAVLNADGTTDTTYSLEVNGEVTSILEQSDGRLIIAGKFTTVGDTTRYCLARLNTDGTLDSWNPYPNTTVNCIKQLSDGRYLVGGQFTSFTFNAESSSTSAYYLALLKTDGSVDTSFKPVIDSYVDSIEIQSDGKILLGGEFTAMAYGATSYTRKYIARLTSDLKIDEDFAPTLNGAVNKLLQTPDGDIVMTGYFSYVNSKVRYYVARLNSDGTLDANWDLNPNQYVYDMALRSDGSVLLAGPFSWFTSSETSLPTHCPNLAKVSATGVIDASFKPSIPGSTGGSVEAISIDDDRTVTAAGSFTNFGLLKANHLARFGPNGAPDSVFAPNPDAKVRSVLAVPLVDKIPVFSNRFVWLTKEGTTRTDITNLEISKMDGKVNCQLVLSDGRIVIGGSFTVPVGLETYKNLVMLNADGTINASFRPDPNSAVFALALDSSKRLLVGGQFSSIGGVSINYLVRMSLTGTVETTFNIDADSYVSVLTIQSDKKILVGGAFTLVTQTASSTTRKYLARFNEDGTLDTAFAPEPDAMPYAITVLSDNRLLISGAFSSITPSSTSTTTSIAYMMRLAADGTLDTTFKPTFNAPVYAHAVQSDGKIVVGGAFTTVQPNDATDTTDLTYIGRINADGTLDTTFTPTVDDVINGIVVQSDGKILIGGPFTKVNDTAQAYIARLNADGTLDTTYTPKLDATVTLLTVYTDGSIIPGGTHSYAESDKAVVVGGDFTTIGNESRAYLAMVNARGQAVAAFTARPDGKVYASARQSDGQIIVAGAFTKIGDVARKSLARVNEKGVLDSLSVTMDGIVSTVAVQKDGRILIGGTFTKVAGVSRAGIARLNSDGTLDNAFNPGVDGEISAIRAELNGSIYVVGAFQKIGGASQPYIARLSSAGVVDSTFAPTTDAAVRTIYTSLDGSIYIGGLFTKVNSTARAGIATLTSTGALADSLTTGADGSVNSIAMTSDGRLVLGGSFTHFRGEASYLLTRLGNNDLPHQSLVVEPKTGSVRWYRSGHTSQIESVVFEYSLDGMAFVRIGTATTPDNGATWEASGYTFLPNKLFYIRARGVGSVNSGGSSSLVDKIGVVYYSSTQNYTSDGVINAKLNTALSIGGSDNLNGTVFTATGLPAGMYIDPTTGRIYGTPTEAGAYVVKVYYTNGMIEGYWIATIVVGSGQSSTDSSTAKVTAFSTRGVAFGSHPVIIGFYVTGDSSMPLMLRGVGPSLVGVSEKDRLQDVRIRLFRHVSGSTEEVVSKNGWSHSAEFDAATARLGFTPFVDGSKDSAVLVTLAPGAYSFWVESTTGGGGVVMGEVYDANQAGQVGASRLTGCSARGYVTGGQDELIGGFVLENQESTKTLVRAVGPSLAARGVASVMSNPVVYLYQGGSPLARNDNWSVQEAALSSAIFLLPAAEIQAAMPTPALYLQDAALMAKLQQGIYTVVATSADGGSGEVLLEFLML